MSTYDNILWSEEVDMLMLCVYRSCDKVLACGNVLIQGGADDERVRR